jgi:hypothetical protein
MNHPTALSPRQTRALAALANCRTLQEAAKQAHVGFSSLKRWLAKDALFRQAWREVQADMVGEACAQAMRSATAAAIVLHQIMMSSESDFAKIASAKALLEVSIRTIERSQLEGRLEGIVSTMETLREQAGVHVRQN